MALIPATFFREWINIILALILLYYLIMDGVLYHTLQNTSLVKEAELGDDGLRPFFLFHPLTIRLIVLDHTNHYIFKPLTDVFSYVTKIHSVVSTAFIIVCHVIVSVVVGKFVSSDSLRHRRMGVVLFEIRTWLVCLAGVVYRSNHGRLGYTSFNGVYGTTANTVCDVIGGWIFCGGVCVYLLKYSHRKNDISASGNNLNKSPSAVPNRGHVTLAVGIYGLLVGIAYGYLAFFIGHLEKFLEKSFPDPDLTTVQTTLLHSAATWLFLWLWRFFTQQMFQYLAVAVVLDKAWEYLSRALFVCTPAVAVLMSLCYIYIVHMNSLILGGEFAS